MTPELSAPTERFFEALLEQKKPEPKTTMKTMTRKMADATNKKTTEVRGGKITPFSGKHENLEKFLETIGLDQLLC